MVNKCYDCKHRRTVPGSAHSRCGHPSVAQEAGDPLGNAFAIFASVGRTSPVVSSGAHKLNVKGNPHGIRKGWFNWPWNFDPTWLETCDGFEEEGRPTQPTEPEEKLYWDAKKEEWV